MAAKAEEAEHNFTHENQRLVETIKKEERTQKLYTTFTVNPATFAPITGKPNAPDPFEGDTAEAMKIMAQRSSVPKVKHPFPMTSAQEYGWDSDKALPRGQFYAGRQMSEITSYYEEYFKHKQQQTAAVKDAAPK